MPSAGMDTVSPPGQLPDGKGPVVRNFLPEFPNKMVMRGPIDGAVVNKSTWTLLTKTAPLIVDGWAVHNDRILLTLSEGKHGLGTFDYIPDWRQPYIKGGLGSEAWKVPKYLVWINLTTGEIRKVGEEVSAWSGPGHTYAKLEGITYYVQSYHESSASDQNGSRQSLRQLFKWNGTSQGWEVLNAAPRGMQFLKSYLNRIWGLGGVPVGAATAWRKFGNRVEVTSGKGEMTVYGSASDIEEFFDVSMSLRIVGKTSGEVSYVSFSEVATEKYKVNLIGTWSASTSGTYKIEGLTAGFEPSTLFFSDAGGPLGNEAKYWQDDVSGLTNKIVVGTDDQQDYGVGLAIVGSTLIIFKRKSIWALYGTSPETFQVRNLTYEFGCIDPHSILESHYGVYFASQNGLQYFNGEQFTIVDDSISNITRPLMQSVAGNGHLEKQRAQTQFGRICVEDIGNGYLMLTIVSQVLNNKSGAFVEEQSFCGIMNYETHNWAELTAGEGGFRGAGVPLIVTRMLNQPVIYDGDFLTDINKIVNVESPNANGNPNIDSAHSPKTAIPAKIATDRITLASPGYAAQLHRIMQDYTWRNLTNDENALPGWWLSLVDADGTVVQEPVQLPGQGLGFSLWPTKYPRGRRWVTDNFNELVDGRLEIEWKSSTMEPYTPELYDCTVEFEVTKQRRST